MADALGFAAFATEITPAMEDLLPLLAPPARQKFCPDLDAMRQSLAAELECFERWEPGARTAARRLAAAGLSQAAPDLSPPGHLAAEPALGRRTGSAPRLLRTAAAALAGAALALLWLTSFDQ